MTDAFHIKWDEQYIIYEPFEAKITDKVSGQKYSFYKNPVSFLPPYHEDDESILHESFQPFCLTVYLSHQCNLSCGYCYKEQSDSIQLIEIDAVIAAANKVAGFAKELGMPFVLGFHGGNEPMLHREYIEKCIDVCRQIAEKSKLNLWLNITTNGIISEETALWASQTFSGITLSWDGPAEVFNIHRIAGTDSDFEGKVKASFKIFSAEDSKLKQLKVRVTASNQTIEKLPESVKYLIEQGVQNIEVFPVYNNVNNSISPNLIPDTAKFVEFFIKSQIIADEHDVQFAFAGSRLGDSHDRFCTILQNNLTLTPEGAATACFLLTKELAQHENLFYAKYDKESKSLSWDVDKINQLYTTLIEPIAQCDDCFNFWHCSKSCPAACPFIESKAKTPACFIEKSVGLFSLLHSVFPEIDYESFVKIKKSISINSLPVEF